MFQVFISYSRRDLPFIERLAKDLKSAGLDVWYDLSGLEGGQRWGSEIQEAIQKSQYFIVVLSPHSVASEWVEKEFMYAHNLGRKVVPILYQSCDTPMWVSNLHFIDMQKGNYQRNITALLIVLEVGTRLERDNQAGNIGKPMKEPTLPRKKLGLKIVFILSGFLLVGFFLVASLLWGKDIAAAIFPAETATSTFTPPSTFTPAHTSAPTITLTPTLGIGSTMERSADDMLMVYVPEGEFTMGSAEGVPQDQPPHPVFLDSYWIDQTEVTNAMYALCVSADVCKMPHRSDSESRTSYFGNSDFSDFPVIAVDWEEARDYCEWAGGRLPTEAEWEKAARGTGTDARRVPWQSNETGCTLANYYMSGIGPCEGDTTRVGSYPSSASPYGTLDQAGNVLEWVADFFGTYPATLVRNPTGPASGEKHVARGGSFLNYSFFIYSYHRFSYSTGYWSLNHGFRCALPQP